MYGTPTDPMPFIYGAYFCGVLFCVGGFVWVAAHRKKLEIKLAALKAPDREQ